MPECPARAVVDSELLKYSDLLTPYALRFVSAELTRSAKQFAVPVSTTTTSGDCHFRRGMMLPCMHMFKLRRTSNVPDAHLTYQYLRAACVQSDGVRILPGGPSCIQELHECTSPVRVPRWPAAATRNTSKSAPEIQDGISCVHTTCLNCQRSVWQLI